MVVSNVVWNGHWFLYGGHSWYWLVVVIVMIGLVGKLCWTVWVIISA